MILSTLKKMQNKALMLPKTRKFFKKKRLFPEMLKLEISKKSSKRQHAMNENATSTWI